MLHGLGNGVSVEVVIAFKIAGSRVAQQPHVIYHSDAAVGIELIHLHPLVVRQLLSKVLTDIGVGEGVIRKS